MNPICHKPGLSEASMPNHGCRWWRPGGWAALGFLLLAASSVRADEPLTVDFGEISESPTASASPAPGAFTPLPTSAATTQPANAPSLTATSATWTPTPAASPSEAMAVSPQAQAMETAVQDAGGEAVSPTSENSDEGVVLVAPGTESPADSLATFGIESPFGIANGNKGPQGTSPSESSGEGENGLEMGVDSTQEPGQAQVSMVGPNGQSLPQLDRYSLVERAGAILSEAELRVDGRIDRNKNGSELIGMNDDVFLKIEQGKQVYPGSGSTGFSRRGCRGRPH